MKRTVLGLILGLSATSVVANSGAYLAGRQAIIGHDYAQATGYLSSALLLNPTNSQLQLLTMQSNLAQGNFDQAVEIASWLGTGEAQAPLADLVVLVQNVREANYEQALTRLDKGVVAGGSIDTLIRAWAHMGLNEFDQAHAVLDTAATDGGIRAFALTHKAFALATQGEFEQARAIFEGEPGGAPGVAMTERAALAYSQILTQMGDADMAYDFLISRYTGTDNAAALALAAAIRAGDVTGFEFIQSPSDAVSEVFYTVAQALQLEQDPDVLLLYTRLAHELSAKNTDALLLSAKFLEELENPTLATVAYDLVPRTDPAYLRAELGRAKALEQADRPETAIEVLSQLAEAYPDVRRVHMALGNLLRREKDYAGAQASYDLIIDRIAEPVRTDWFVFFVRGVTFEQRDMWEEAQQDMRKSIALDGKQASVLNYLGYSYVDRGVDLQEGLSLIERADAAQPGQGHIIDSLGWAYYQLGDYPQAVLHLERAIEVMATDAVVNDHLGDAYWQVGRTTEADFQWRRALSFEPEGEAADLVREKLESGMVDMNDAGDDVLASDDQ